MNKMAKSTIGELYQSREYHSWNSMKNRCNNPNLKEYKNYGGRGISYDPRWEDFREFYKDMGKRPEGTTLDRIDVDKNYCKENCRWATREQQQHNLRIHKKIDVGITFDEKHPTCKYQAGINFKNKRYANRFKTFKEAYEWRKRKEKELWEIQE